MDSEMKRLCTICARGGSEGVKGKNVRPMLGKPLIVYSIEQARESRQFDAIAISSDSEGILSIAGTIIGWIPFLGWVIGGLIGVLTFILWLVLMIKAYQGEKFKIPWAGDFAEKQVS